MSELTIGRLTATVHAKPGSENSGGPVDRMLRRLAEQRLEAALVDAQLPAGDWCVRRVETIVRYDPRDHESDIEAAWAGAVLASLCETLHTANGDIVHYRRPGDAVADLITSITMRRLERVWAWRQMGLLGQGDPEPGVDPAGAVLAAVARRPDLALAAVAAAVSAAGAAALHRTLGTEGWLGLATIVATAAGCHRSDAELLLGPAGSSADPRQVAADLVARAQEASATSGLARAFRRAGLRPRPAALRAWAVLALAECDPAVLRVAHAGALVDAVASALAAADKPDGLVTPPAATPTRRPSAEPGRVTTQPSPDSPAPTEDALPPSAPAVGRDEGSDDRAEAGTVERVTHNDAGTVERTDAADSPSPPEPVAEPATDGNRVGAFSDWAGVLFMLATAEAAGVPDLLLDDPRLGARSVRWSLHRLALLLTPAAADDPAALALAGLPPDAEAPDGPPTTAPERAALAAVAARWRVATAHRMGPSTLDPVAVVARVVRRRGEIDADPGWIEVHLDLDEVDVDVRRAGLDIDPGWVPWLGAVVRYRYV